MKLLAIDTSTLTAGVALFDTDRGLLVPERRHVVTTHSEALLPLIDGALAEAGLGPRQLDAVVCAAGPGSFTGLRIGISTAKGLCFALGRPLVLISSLEALAARAADGPVCATLDALKGEVYAGLFTVAGGAIEAGGEELVAPPEALRARLLAVGGGLQLVGSGALRYPELVVPGARLLDEDGAPRPGDLARLGAARLSAGSPDDLARSGPKYIRASEAEIAYAKKVKGP
jgi:tRNA threonylcarbamoyladenosine biosynthesis protein TsaB